MKPGVHEVNTLGEKRESPEYVRISHAAAMTLGFVGGRFFRDAKLYCLNLLLTYGDGCVGRCAYCGLSRGRWAAQSWGDQSFIRVDWPTVPLDEIVSRMNGEFCSHVERVCISMVTNRRARKDTISVVKRLHERTNSISALITPTIVDMEWLHELNGAGADKLGVAIDAATPELFERLRGKGVNGPHRWDKYWRTVDEGVEVFGRYNVGVHLIVGLGETEEEMVKVIQEACEKGALTHLFSFFPEEGSPMQDHPQPPIGKYRRIQLARYLINKGMVTFQEIAFDREGMLVDFGIGKEELDRIIESGLPFMTSGCSGGGMENACNRPFSDYTPYQACLGELRNYPFIPTKEDVELIRRQLWDRSELPVRCWT